MTLRWERTEDGHPTALFDAAANGETRVTIEPDGDGAIVVWEDWEGTTVLGDFLDEDHARTYVEDVVEEMRR